MISRFSKPSRRTLLSGIKILAILIFACLIANPPNAMSQTGAVIAYSAKDEFKPKTTDGAILVRVLGPDGEPVAGAKIHKGVWTKEPAKHNDDYVCGDNGEATVDLPKTLDILRLWARSGGFVPLFAHWEQYDPEQIPKQFTFKLEKGTVIGGMVNDEDGKPIADAKVEVSCSMPNGEQNRVSVNRWLAEEDTARATDAQGRWTLDNVPKGNDIDVAIRVNHPDYVSDLTWGGFQRMQNVTLASLREQKGTIVLYKGISLTGKVTNPDGKPVAKAVVVWGDDPYMQASSAGHPMKVLTDEHGVYKLPPLPPLTLTVTVMAEGFAPELKKIKITRNNPKADFQLKPGKKLRIKFIDDNSKPIPDVYVLIDSWRNCKSLYTHRHPNVLDAKIPDKADKNGIYEWAWAPGDSVFYNFGKQGYREARPIGLTANGKEHEIRLEK
jgi:protocatechuate 3,4-dioxygenase beta subunit